MTQIVIEITGEPQGKGRPRFARSGHTYTPASTRRYEAALRFAAQEEMGGRPPFEGALELEVVATFPVPTSWSRRKREAALSGALPHTIRPDVDNLLKTIDSLNEVVWRDDKQVIKAVVRKCYGARPCLRLEISEVQP